MLKQQNNISNPSQNILSRKDTVCQVQLYSFFDRERSTPLFSENSFTRCEAKVQALKIITDRLWRGEREIAVAYIHGRGKQVCQMTFDKALHREDDCVVVADDQDWQYLIVLPIYSRHFDEKGRICKEQECKITLTDQSLFVYPGDYGCNFNIYRGRNLLEITEPHRFNVERRVFAIYGKNTISPLFLSKYLINGKIYDPRPKPRVDNKRECQEQVAYILYGYFGMLYRATEKSFYRAIQTIIAYTVALRVENDGRLRHGTWTDDMETHWRFEAEALQLLTIHYQQFGGVKIAEVCKKMAACIRKYADKLGGNSLWFLHDTLENTEKVKTGYPTLVCSRAFGKDWRNTLALNTHLCSLVALVRYADVFEDSEVRADVEAGVRSLRRIISRHGGDRVFALLFKAQHMLFGRKTRFFNPLMRRLTRLLLYAKKIWPRLVMPNGAIERDLSASAFSRRYHVVNLKDLLKIGRYYDLPELKRVILDGLRYAIKQNLDKNDIKGHPGGKFWPEVLIGSIAIQDNIEDARQNLQMIVEYRDALKRAGLAWPFETALELEPGEDWVATLRDLPLENDLFEFRFKGARYWLLLGEKPNISMLSGRSQVDDLPVRGACVFRTS